jgi:NAD(P)-dependent dehydrogenase (short-subunit alcohol dehydrogenase family)
MPTIAVAGASRGIGLELVRQFSASGWRALGTAREMSKGAEISKAGGEVYLCDVADAASVARLGQGLAKESIDILVCNAGIYGPRDWALGNTDYAAWQNVMQTNLFAPLRVVEALVECVARSNMRTIGLMSSRMGSIAQSSGDSVIYRTSKAALNALGKNLSVMLAARGINVVCLHPGWVRTDMGGASAAISVEESAAGLKQVLTGVGPAENGKFFNYDGSEISW